MAKEEISGEIYVPSAEEMDEGTLDEPVTTTLVRTCVCVYTCAIYWVMAFVHLVTSAFLQN